MKFGTLHLKFPDGKTRDYPLDQPSVSLGRAQGNDLIVEDTSVSRRHARLSVESGKLLIEDLGSANGTFVGSQRLAINTPGPVPEDQIVRLGDVEVRYTPPPAIAATQAFAKSPTEVVAPVSSAAPVSLSLVGPAQPVTPGMVTTANLTLQNRGAVVDELIIKVSGIPIEWVRLSKERVPLLPNAQDTVTITFAPPRRPDATAADHAFTISVVSREHHTGANATGTLKVLPFQGFSLNLNPQRSTRDFQLMVQNQGNAPTAYRFHGSDDEQVLTYQFGQDGVTLQPGQSGAIALHVAPKIKPRVGTRETRSFNIIASPLDAAAAETKAAGQLIIRPPIPVWLIPLVLLLTLCMCVSSAWAYTQVCGTLGSNLPLCPTNAKPVINVFNATPFEIEKGGTIALTWDVSNADQVELIAPVQETLTKSGVKTINNIEQSTSFTLKATNKVGGSVDRSVTVKLKNTPPVIQSFKADPAAVTAGRTDKVALSWVVAGADAVSIEGVPGVSGATGSAQVDPPTADKTYTLNATNSAGTTQGQVTIHVASAGCTVQSAADMREGPALEYRVIDSLTPGMAVLPVGRNATGEWLRVQANREGWVSATAIQCTVAMLQFATISPNEIPPAPTATPTATPPPTDTPVPTPPPVVDPGGPWGGQWETTFGPLNITQSGSNLVGTYQNGGVPGTVTAVVSGNRARGTWAEGARSGTIDWWLTSSGKKWRGNFDAVSAWCGHRAGETDPNPCGVGSFDGTWTVCAPSCVVTMKIVQDGNKWTATYDNGTMEGTIENNLATGTYLYQNSFPGTIGLRLLNANQFTGNYDTVNDWCGYRNGASKPVPCLGP